mgnify:CR=1 FL=1
MKNRVFDYVVLDEIQKRWSPRAFDPEQKVTREDIMPLLEAARYAPSCFNEQPCRYIVATSGNKYDKILSALADTNREWAVNAPVLMVILSKQLFDHNQKNNRWHLFDAGASWAYLNLEAQRRGLVTHAMGGFNTEKIRETFDIPADFSIIAIVAIGYYGNKEELSPENQEREIPSPRKSIEEIMFSADDSR